MAADVDWDIFFHRLWIGVQRPELEILALERGRTFAPERTHRLDGFVGHRAATVEIDPERLEFLFHPAAADPKHHAPARQHVKRRDLFSGVNRMPLRQNQYAGRKFDRFGDRRNICERYERILDWHIIAA